MTDEEMKELQVLEARNLKIFTEPGNKGLADILRLRFLQGKKEGYEKDISNGYSVYIFNKHTMCICTAQTMGTCGCNLALQ